MRVQEDVRIEDVRVFANPFSDVDELLRAARATEAAALECSSSVESTAKRAGATEPPAKRSRVESLTLGARRPTATADTADSTNYSTSSSSSTSQSCANAARSKASAAEKTVAKSRSLAATSTSSLQSSSSRAAEPRGSRLVLPAPASESGRSAKPASNAESRASSSAKPQIGKYLKL